MWEWPWPDIETAKWLFEGLKRLGSMGGPERLKGERGAKPGESMRPEWGLCAWWFGR